MSDAADSVETHDFPSPAGLFKVLSFLDGLTEADFAKTTPEVKIKIPGPSGKALRANDFLIARQIPNFHFHVVTAYNILRQGGVEIGKRDYLGELPLVDP